MARTRRTGSWYSKRKIDVKHVSMKEAVIYARVSTPDQQREGYSIPAQLKLLEDYAALNGIFIASQHVDVETARKSGRTAFGDMLRYLRRHPQVRTLLVEKTDRLYRNLKDWGTIDDLGLEIHFVKENVVMSDGCRSSEKFVHGIKVLMAKAYVDNLSEETRKGMLEKAQQGIWPSFAPIGYLNVAEPGGRKIIIDDPHLGPLVTRLFDWFSTGEYSLKTVTAKARAAGLFYRKSGKPIGVSTVHHILRNRIYTGAFDWLGTTYVGVHQPLTSPALWHVVQDVIDQRSCSYIHVPVEDFPFRGLIKCGHCGCALVAEIKKGKYIYYHCTGYRGKCPEPYVGQEALEDHFVGLLRRLWCSEQDFQPVRQAIANASAEDSRIQPISTFRDKAYLAGKPGALAQDGTALIDMGRTSSLSLGGLSSEIKRQLLQLLLATCSWANGALTATFNPPFDILADYVNMIGCRAGTLAIKRDPQGFEFERFSTVFQHPDSDLRQFIARYNAMVRIQQDDAVGRTAMPLGIDLQAEAT